MGEKDGDIIRSKRDSVDQGFMHFIWNPQQKEFCGRNGMSWLKIGGFYVIFYLLLAGFWAVMLLIFYQTLDYYTPKWTLDSSRIGSNPGLGFRPLPHPDNVDSTLIWFTHSGEQEGGGEEWRYWTNALNDYIKPYRGGHQFGEHVKQCNFQLYYPEPVVCEFKYEKLSSDCSYSNHFGYDQGHPCILLKINRIYGWKPEPYTNDTLPASMPDHIRKNYNPDYVYISCDGENPADQENIGPVQYYPAHGRIPKYYFPFTNLDGYLSPFVFIKFLKPAYGVLINIECKAWASNIKHDRSDRMGSVHFELMID